MPKYPTVTSKVIDYNSPSGKVTIGKYIPPFEEVENGFGYKGVIVEDVKTNQIQCHICGEWYNQLGLHIKKHGLNTSEYKRRFGLLQTTALKSHRLRLRQSIVMQELRKKYKQCNRKFERNNLYAGNRKNKPKAEESKNKYGVCDLQIMQKVIELKEELGKTPTLTDLKERYGGGFIFHLNKRYNSYIRYCKELGLKPNISNFNPKYSREYFIKKALNKEPSIRIFTINEGRALYKYFKGGINELKREVNQIKIKRVYPNI